MELNEPVEGHEHATTSLKVILLVFSVVVIGALGYLVSTYNQIDETPDTAAPQVLKEVSTKESTETVNEESTTVACGDKEYAFSLTFGEQWQGNKIKEVKPNYALVTCYITLPTTSKDTIWTEGSTDHDAGYASIFAVSVYTPEQWEEAKKEANTPTELGKNNSYVWGWSQAQALPDDLQAKKISDDIKNVVSTFKIN